MFLIELSSFPKVINPIVKWLIGLLAQKPLHAKHCRLMAVTTKGGDDMNDEKLHEKSDEKFDGTPDKKSDAQAVGNRLTQGSLLVLAYLWGSIFFMEIVLRLNTGSPFFNLGLWYTFLFSGTAAFLIYFLVSFFKETARAVIMGMFLFLTTLLFVSQLIYYQIFKMFYTVYSAQNGAQVLEFAKDIFVAIGKNFSWILLLFMPFLLFLVLRRRAKGNSSYKFTPLERGRILAVSLILFGLSIVSLNLGDKDINSPYNLYYQNSYQVASVNRLGLVTTMRLDLQRTIIGFEPELAPPPPLPEDLRPGTKPVASSTTGPEATLPGVHTTNGAGENTQPPGQEGHEPLSKPVPEPEPLPVYKDQVMDIDFEEIIKNESDQKLKDMHTYFSQRIPTKENEMTGRYKGYNLILIVAEAYSGYAIDKDVTPTLYKMSEEGVKFTNFYNPLWGVSTSDGEYVASTGLIPKNGVWSMYKSARIAMPFAMGNQLKRLGYTTKAYHNHTFDYYRRDLSHPNLGYDYKGLGNGLNVRPTWPESDLEMMELTLPEYKDQIPFHTYYMTVSGHMRYTWDANFIASKNKALVQNLPYTQAGLAYIAGQIELDRALEYLLAELEQAGVLDHTLIGMSADHYPYGLENSEISDLAGHKIEENFELYKSSFILYNSKMEPLTMDRPVSSLDIIPTISNLMDVEFDSRLMMGIDMFSDQAPLVIFDNRSFITDLGRYNALTKTFTLNDGVTMSDAEKQSYRIAISNEIDRQFYYSARILETDYYSLVVKRD